MAPYLLQLLHQLLPLPLWLQRGMRRAGTALMPMPRQAQHRRQRRQRRQQRQLHLHLLRRLLLQWLLLQWLAVPSISLTLMMPWH